jgi:uncharacterized membrane protein YdjX (TVP38/TMEM64 family)
LTRARRAGHRAGMIEPAPRSSRALLQKLAAAGAVLLVTALLLARGLDLKALVQQGLEIIRNAGPVAFFTGMALLPAAGVPMLAFSLPAISVFGERLGTGLVVLLSLTAVTVNIALTYVLARRGLRPLLEKLVARLGYRLPQAETGDAADLIVILRVAPGVPFFVQNYLLGLANVPAGKYLLVSCLIAWPLNIGFLLFGDALLHGKGRLALVSISLLGALTAVMHLIRKHYNRSKPVRSETSQL